MARRPRPFTGSGSKHQRDELFDNVCEDLDLLPISQTVQYRRCYT